MKISFYAVTINYFRLKYRLRSYSDNKIEYSSQLLYENISWEYETCSLYRTGFKLK